MSDVLVPKSLVSDISRFGGRPEGDCLRGQPEWHNGRLVGLSDPQDEHVLGVCLPKLVETHCHLDKCHTLPRLGPVGGDLAGAIAAQALDKKNWTADDVVARAEIGLSELLDAGCDLVRSHVDWGHEATPPTAWNALKSIKHPALQMVPLTGMDQMADPAFAETVAAEAATTSGVLGSFILHHAPALVASGLSNMFSSAQRHELMLDFHVDEGLGDWNGLEAIADMALSTRFERPILCGHAVSLMDRTAEDFDRIADKLARAGITICALPTTNLYLQGRMDGTPDRRGITRLAELNAAGVRVVVGSDNVADAFCPTGQHDPRHALYLATLAAHLDPPLDRWLPLITTHARAALGQPPIYVDGAHPDDLWICKTSSIARLVAGPTPFEQVNP